MHGWVKETSPFTLEDFVSKYTNRELAEDEIKNLKIMLEAITKLPEDTVVKVRYTRRGIEEKRMDLVVHKVFFYD